MAKNRCRRERDKGRRLPPRADPVPQLDHRFFATLVRFDVAYHGAFKCSIRRIEDYPSLSSYLREITNGGASARAYASAARSSGYYSLRNVNPTGIVPAGPAIDFDRPHDRDRLPGRGVFRAGSMFP